MAHLARLESNDNFDPRNPWQNAQQALHPGVSAFTVSHEEICLVFILLGVMD